MNYYKIIIYTFLIALLIGGPIYGVSRLILPEWLKSQISERLPEGSSLSIDTMSSNLDLSINYNNIEYINNKKTFKLNLSGIVISPKFSIKEPLELKAKKAYIQTEQLNAVFSNLNFKISVNYNDISNSKIYGNMERLNADQIAAFLNITFLLEGLNSPDSNLEINSDKLALSIFTPMGPISVLGEKVNLKAKMGQDLFSKLSSKTVSLDLSSIGNKDNNKIINGKDLILELNLIKENDWSAPLSLIFRNISFQEKDTFENFLLKAKGRWSNIGIGCSWNDLLLRKEDCGKLIDLVDVDVKMNSGDSKINFSGNGYCVTPSAGCPQKIKSKIQTKNTTDVFSKIMTSGVVNPLFAGIVLGSLLGSPSVENSDFDHEVNFEVKGSKISINGKPLIN